MCILLVDVAPMPPLHPDIQTIFTEQPEVLKGNAVAAFQLGLGACCCHAVDYVQPVGPFWFGACYMLRILCDIQSHEPTFLIEFVCYHF